MVVLLITSLFAASPVVDLSGSLAQVEKQALRVSELAQDIAQTAETGLASGQPYGLAMLETDLASIQIHLRRLNAALAELEKKVVASDRRRWR